MSLETLKHNQIDIIKFSGKLDVGTMVALEGEVVSFLRNTKSRELLFDVIEAQYVSASAIHLFLSVKDVAEKENIKVGIIASDIVRNIFSSLEIDSFRFYNDLESACNDIKN